MSILPHSGEGRSYNDLLDQEIHVQIMKGGKLSQFNKIVNARYCCFLLYIQGGDIMESEYNDYSKLKQVLKLLRIAHDNMGIKDLSKLLGVSAAYVSDLESEKSNKKPSLKLLDKYSEIFGIKTSDIPMLAEDESQNTYQRKLRKILDVLAAENEV